MNVYCVNCLVVTWGKQSSTREASKKTYIILLHSMLWGLIQRNKQTRGSKKNVTWSLFEEFSAPFDLMHTIWTTIDLF